MNELFFVDTNIFVYSRDSYDIDKNKRALLWLDFLWKSKRGITSIQVLTEYFEVVRRNKLTDNISLVENDIKRLFLWDPIENSKNTLEKAFSIRQEFFISWWDSLVVSSALLVGAKYFLSEDLQNNLVIENIKVINPFLISPEQLL